MEDKPDIEPRALLEQTFMSIAGLYREHRAEEPPAALNLGMERMLPLLADSALLRHGDYRAEVLTVCQVALEQMSLGAPSLLAALAFRPLKLGVLPPDFAREQLGPEVDEILAGLKKLSDIDTKDISYKMKAIDSGKDLELEKAKRDKHAENFIQMLLTLAKDVRAILLRLAFRLHRLRGLALEPQNTRDEIAEKISLSHTQVAHRLGLYKLKTEMEELDMKFRHNDMYRDIARKLAATKAEREGFISEFVAPIEKLLKGEGIQCKLKGRPKSIHSIWTKMKSQGVPFEGIYDLFAIRVILTADFGSPVGEPDFLREKSECWKVYSIITHHYLPNPKRLRDWISNPKNSGYESLHTTVLGPAGRWVEVQIRTERMDEIAEKGHAAHWKYKKKTSGTASDGDSWLAKVRDMLENSTLSLPTDSKAKRELYDNTEIFIFTPNRELKKIDRDATVLDFAFKIHTQLGCTCIGAKVNGEFKPLKHVLQNGDTVEILTSKSQKPSPNWLNYVKTAQAKAKIKKATFEEQYSKAEIGKEALMRKLEQWQIQPDQKRFSDLLAKLEFSNHHQFYHKIGSGELDLNRVKEALSQMDQQAEQKAEAAKDIASNAISQQAAPAQKDQSGDFLVIDNNNWIDFERAKCCNPIPGDDIFGFVTVSKGTKIHKTNCPNAKDMVERHPYRVVEAQWKQVKDGKASFQATVHVSGDDRIGISKDILQIISDDLKVNMQNVNFETRDGAFFGRIELSVRDINHLGLLLRKIKSIRGVKKASRG